jgi:hypothetical protein
VKRDLKDWSITKELTLDRKEWKLEIHVLEPWFLLFCCFFVTVFSLFPFYSPLFTFFLVFDCLFSFLGLVFYHPSFSPLFSSLFCLCFLTHVVLSLKKALLRTRLGTLKR